ncbi:GntR family transcriptional regulator [Nocardia sp. NPDC101769]|uniref:GntR family transcriptional regulator n=1 Tax=Nocardia sp. NPDC101769 TaxID=3364333 RepID=UPI00382EE1E9
MTYAAVKPPGSRAGYVQEALRSEILSGAMPPGTPILQDKVAERLGVSITPVREALRRLTRSRRRCRRRPTSTLAK